jgi:predicted nucleic acid-binding protein
MRYVYIEPSVWVKHYIAEPGTDVANDLFAQLLPQQRALLCSRLGLPEVVSAINRRRNAGHLNQAAFNVLYHQFEADRRAIRLLPVRNYQITASIRLLLAHNLNATDALHLQVALEVHSRLHAHGDALLFCSRSRVYRTVRSDRQGTLGWELDEAAHLGSPVRTTVWLPTLRRSLGALLKVSPQAYGWCRTRWSCATLALTL